MADSDPKNLFDRAKVLEMSDEEILRVMSDDWAESKNYFEKNDIFERNRRYEKTYNANDPVPPPTEKQSGGILLNPKGRAKNFYPITTAIVDTAIAMTIESLFSVEEYFMLMPTQDPEEQSHLEAMTRFLQWDAGPTRLQLRDRMEEWITSAFKFDWAVADISWSVSGANVLRPKKTHVDRIAEKMGQRGGKFKEVLNRMLRRRGLHRANIPAFEAVYDPAGKQGPEMEILNLQNTRPDPHAIDFDDNCRFFMDEFESPWTKLLSETESEDNPAGIYKKSKMDEFETLNASGSTRPEEQRKAEGDSQKGVGEVEKGRDIVKLRRWRNQYAEFVSDENFQLLLRKVPKDGWTLCKLSFKNRTKRWEGYSMIGMIEKLNYEINSVANQRRDNINLVLDPIAILNKRMWNKIWNGENTTLHPGKQLWVDGDVRQAAAFMRPPDVTQTAGQEISFIMGIIEKLAHISENTMGNYRSQGRRTATEAEYVQTGQTINAGPIAKRFERHGLRWALSRIIREEELNLTEDVYFQVLGETATYRGKMSPDILSQYGPNIDVMPIGSNFAENSWPKVQQRMEAIKMMYDIQPIAQMMNHKYVGRILAEGANIRGIQNLFNDDTTLFVTIPAQIEDVMMIMSGQNMVTHPADNHEEHIGEHMAVMETPEFAAAPQGHKSLLQAHIAMHKEDVEEKNRVKPGPNPQQQVSGIGDAAGVARGVNAQSQSPQNIPAELVGGEQ